MEEKNMKGKNVGKVLAKTFGKTIGVLFLLLAVGVASYFLTMIYYKTTLREERANSYEHVIEVKTGTDSANLIYGVNKENGKVETMVLELYEGDTHNLDYVTIPAQVEVEIPSDMYIQLMEVSKEMPQIVKISNINDYFKGDVAFEYGILLLEKEMGIDIGYFTAMSSEMFSTYFNNVGTKGNPQYAPSDEIRVKIGEVTKDSISDFMESTWKDIISDITLYKKQKYAEGLAKVNPKFIHSHRIKATKVVNKKTKTYRIDKTETKKLINKLIENEPYVKEQNSPKTNTVNSTKKNSIWITNGSKITGLAASFKEKLVNQGFQVKGIGDYKGEIQTYTKILVKNKKHGKELLGFFSNAKIEVSSKMTEDVDIEIILGTNDRL